MAKDSPQKAPEIQQPYAYFDAVYPWQMASWQNIAQNFPKIPHAILFSGHQGTGKRAFADHLAAWLLCQHRQPLQACGECSSCQWLKADTHPSLLRISRETDAKGKQSQFIKIDQIRSLMPFVQQTGEGRRVIVIEPAEALNIAAANALLKTLEEPSERVTLILIADQSLQLPATIRSRLQQYKVGLVDAPQALSYMMQVGQMTEDKAKLLLALSGGAPLNALKLNQQNTFQSRADWLKDWQKLTQQQLLPMSCSSQWQKRLSLFEFLEVLQWMLRDIIAQHVGQAVIQSDLDFDELCKNSQLDRLFALQKDILKVYQFQSQNVQNALVYDTLMMQLMNLKHSY
jgi:DNA polymerase-3 subunit delta'